MFFSKKATSLCRAFPDGEFKRLHRIFFLGDKNIERRYRIISRLLRDQTEGVGVAAPALVHGHAHPRTDRQRIELVQTHLRVHIEAET